MEDSDCNLNVQMSLAAARTSLASENATGQPVRHDITASPLGYDSEDTMSMGSRTPRTPGCGTPFKYSGSLAEARAGREGNGSLNNLMKEFEQRRQTFDNNARALVEVKTTGQSANTNSIEELHNLKHRFEGWKKEYKTRLRETKARLKLGHSEMDRNRRKWWGKLSSRAL